MLAPLFNNGAAMDGVPRGGDGAVVTIVPQRAKKGFGLGWLMPIFWAILEVGHRR